MAQVTFAASPGIYYIAVDGVDATRGTVNLQVTAGGLPVGALGMADFVAGIYLWGEETKTAADILSDPARVEASGLSVKDGFENLELIGEFADIVKGADFRAVIEFVITADVTFFGLIDAFDSVAFYDEIYTGVFNRHGEAFDAHFFPDANPEASRYLYEDSEPPLDLDAIHRVCYQRTDAALAISVDGRDALVDSTPAVVGVIVPKVYCGYTSGIPSAGFIRRITFYPSGDTATMPAQSAV